VTIGENLIFSHFHTFYYLFHPLHKVSASYLSLTSQNQRQYIIFYGCGIKNIFAREVSLSENLADAVKRFHFELSSGFEWVLDDVFCFGIFGGGAFMFQYFGSRYFVHLLWLDIIEWAYLAAS
jgi:hypothetical protein